MSEQAEEALTLGTDPAAQMSAVLDFLAPETGEPSAGEGAAEGAPAAAEPGQQPAAGEGTAPGGADAVAPAAGDGGSAAVSADGATAAGAGADAGAAGAEPPAGAVDASSLNEKWGEISTAFETRQAEHLQQSALAEVRTEYKEYFDRLQMHPRLLVGQEVQSLTGQGKEKLRDTEDARDWQDAVKRLLVQEVESRAGAKADEFRDVFTTVHSSIDLFRNNVDLIPGTKQFDKQLADQFAALAKEYELRSDGKLIGYSVPVQPMINQLRSQLASQKAASAAAATATAARQQQAASQPRTPQGQFDGPQEGLTSKAGQSASESEDVAAGLMQAFYRQNGFSI